MKPNITEIVNDFLNDFHEGCIDIKQEASDQITTEKGQTMSLREFLVQAMYNYGISKNDFDAIEEDADLMSYRQAEKEYCYWLSDCYYWIIQLRTLGLIYETEAMKRKVAQRDKEIEKMKGRLDQVTQKNLDLAKLNDELNKILGNFGENGNSSFAEKKP